MTRITTVSTASLGIGERFSIDIPVRDVRRWPRLKAWILRRPPPIITRRQMFRVTEIVSGTAFDVREDA